MVAEVLKALDLHPGEDCVDGTLGDGGHSLAILAAIAPSGRLLGIDADRQAIERARQRLQGYGDRVLLVQGNFANLAAIVRSQGLPHVSGVLLDLGLSSWQLGAAGRGFSFRDEALDMRLGEGQTLTAGEVVNTYSIEDLTRLIATYGEEPQARRIAQALVQGRPFTTAAEVAGAIERVSPRRGQRIHPATRTLQALRMYINQDLENLAAALRQAVELLQGGGRLVTIAYHSLEDRMIKVFMQEEARDCLCPPSQPVCTCGHKATVRILRRKVVKPSEEEVRRNPRVRSARLRACMAR